MRDKRYGKGPTTVHLILIFNSPLLWGIAANDLREKTF